jgi:hypothetical protein
MQQPCPNEDIAGKCSVVRLASLAGGRQHIEIDLSQYQMTINQYQVGTLNYFRSMSLSLSNFFQLFA